MKTLKDIYDERVENNNWKDDLRHLKCNGRHFIGTMGQQEVVSIERFITEVIDSHQTTIALLENMVEWLEGEKKNKKGFMEIKFLGETTSRHKIHDDFDAGYNTALDDTIKYLKEQIKLITNK